MQVSKPVAPIGRATRIVEERLYTDCSYVVSSVGCRWIRVSFCRVQLFARADTRRVFRTLPGDSGRGKSCTWIKPMAIGPLECCSYGSEYVD